MRTVCLQKIHLHDKLGHHRESTLCLPSLRPTCDTMCTDLQTHTKTPSRACVCMRKEATLASDRLTGHLRWSNNRQTEAQPDFPQNPPFHCRTALFYSNTSILTDNLCSSSQIFPRALTMCITARHFVLLLTFCSFQRCSFLKLTLRCVSLCFWSLCSSWSCENTSNNCCTIYTASLWFASSACFHVMEFMKPLIHVFIFKADSHSFVIDCLYTVMFHFDCSMKTNYYHALISKWNTYSCAVCITVC